MLSKEHLPGSADDCHLLLLNIETWYLCTCADTTREKALKTLNHLYTVWNKIKTNLEIDPPTREKKQRLKNENPNFKTDPNAKKKTTDQIIADIDCTLRLWEILEIILKDDMIYEKAQYDKIASDLRNLLDDTHTVEFYQDNIIKKMLKKTPKIEQQDTFEEPHWTDVPGYEAAIRPEIEKTWLETIRKSRNVSLEGINYINNAFGWSGDKNYWDEIIPTLMQRNPYLVNYMCQY